MKNKFIGILLLMILLTNCALKETTDNNTTKTDNSLTLFAPKGGETIYLIDMKKEIVKQWDVGKQPFGKLLDDGRLLYQINADTRPEKAQKSNATIIYADWEGNILWEYTNDYLHHDFTMLPNGNILAIMWEEVSSENKEKLGIDKNTKFWSDVIIEIDYESKEIVWELHLQELLDPEEYPIKQKGKEQEWFHTNAVEYLPEDNPVTGVASVMLSLHHIHRILIVDKESQELVWGYGKGVLQGQHNPTLLENGNILIFDNRNEEEGSRVIEIDPTTKEIVWEYRAADFFSNHISGAQRLANGNTLICEGAEGRIFEVTETGEIVWEYDGGENIFRAYRYKITQ